MKKLILISALTLFSVDVFAGVSDVTLKMLEAKEQLVACDTLELCSKINMEYYTYMYHPDNAKDLESCVEDSKCYEAMMDMTTYLMNDFLSKLSEM